MNVTGWDLWVVIGGALQAGGVVLLVVDVVRAFRRLEAYRTRPIELQVHDAMHLLDSATVTLTTDIEPTFEERVDRLETQIGSLRDELRDANIRAGQVAEAAAERASESVNRRVTDHIGALERALLGDTRRDRWRRLLSIAAVVLGVILATIGSVAG